MSLLGTRHDTPALLAGFEIAVLASLGGAFPSVVGAAMASGVPCLTTDIGDCAWIAGGTGVVVSSADGGWRHAGAAAWPVTVKFQPQRS